LIESENRHLLSKNLNVENVFTWFSQRDYTGFFFESGRWSSTNDFSTARHQNIDCLGSKRYINNFVFIPIGHHLFRTLNN
jgi:hypothetical protein